MKLLSKEQTIADASRRNQELEKRGQRLSEYNQRLSRKAALIKSSLTEEEERRQKEFDQFLLRIEGLREKLLKEIATLEKVIEEKKDILYGIVERQDLLDEREHLLKEKEERIRRREVFVEESEKRLSELTRP